MNSPDNTDAATRKAQIILWSMIGASIIVSLSMGSRHSFTGLFLQPISATHGWGREVFSLAIAVQNIAWGASQPYIGYLSDRYGPRWVWLGGAALYALGFIGVSITSSPAWVTLFGGVCIGVAVSCTAFSVAFSTLGKLIEPSRRSWAFAIASAAGSFGQFFMVPVAQGFLSAVGWQSALLWMAGVVALIAPIGWWLANLGQKALPLANAPVHKEAASAKEALQLAFADRSYLLLIAGFFVCGFHIVFISAHLAPYLQDNKIPAHVGVTALALVGLFNIAGTLLAGYLGGRMPKRWVLSAIYFLRSVAIFIFISIPLTPGSVYFFAASMGFLWLSTVPPTNSIVAQVYGVKYLGMLAGIVFFSHQIGSFLGAWLGGKLYDATGSYTLVWWICIALGVFAALVHLPIDERNLNERSLRPA